MLPEDRDFRAAVAQRFNQSLSAMGRSLVILGHFDADGLAASAIFKRALDVTGRSAEVRIIGKGENAWSPTIRLELGTRRPEGIIVTDLGVREGAILPGTPVLLVDHHVPTGTPGDSVIISGHGLQPEPTSSLLAYWCLDRFADQQSLLWLAALGLIGDMADQRSFPELEEAYRRFGKTALRNAVALINAPRRTAKADATPALRLLLKCNSPKELLSGDHPETHALLAAKEEVKAAMEQAKRVAPKIRGDVALIPLSSACQIHPLVAQQWRSRLRDKVVIAVNREYRPGWVHFAARTGSDADLIRFFAERRPEGADENYGSGHRQASGGALRIPEWNRFVADLGFPEEQIA